MKRFALSIIAFLCLLGWDAPAFAQNYDNKLATYRARMRKENPFRCYFKGQVFAIDEFHEKPFPLEGAHVQAYCTADSAQMKRATTTSFEGKFSDDIRGKKKVKKPEIRIVITYVGMDTLDCVRPAVKTQDEYGAAYEVRLDSVVLHSHPITLEETQIIGELKKMYQKGDTTVFNVDAYEMPEGTVLVQLVRRLPGLRYDNRKKQLTYKGRSIEEMRLNGDTFFKHDISIALKNMPNVKLKQVEVYETERDTLDATKGKMLVMDMKSKEEIKTVFFANAEAATADQKKKYRLTADANLYIKKGPQFSFNGELEDMPDGLTAEDKSIRKHAHGFYDQNFKKASINANFRYNETRNVGKTTQTTSSFLPEDMTNDYSVSEYDNRSRNLNPTLSSDLRLGKKGMLRNYLQFNYTRSSMTNRSSSVATAGEQADTLNLNTTEQRTLTDNKSMSWQGSLFRNVADDDETGIRTNLFYMKNKSRTVSRSHTAFSSLGDSLLDVRQQQANPNEMLTWRAETYYQFRFRKKHFVELSYEFCYGKDDSRTDHTDLTDGPVLTDSLSYATRDRVQQHQLKADLSLEWEKASLSATFSVTPTRDELSTERRDGQAARRVYHFLLHEQHISLSGKLGTYNSIELSYYGSRDMPGTSDLIFIPDYSDPLNIRIGNPDLKAPYNARTELSLNTLKGKGTIRLNYDVTRNATDNRIVFDPETGARRSTPDNINGNYNLGGRLSYYDNLGPLTWGSSATYSYRHTAQFMQYAGESQASRNIGENHSVQVGINPSYSNRFLLTELDATYTFDHRTNRSMPQGDYRLQQYRAEWKATGYIGHDWEVNTRVDWSHRKGMLMGDADGNECIWDLGVAYKLLQQKLTLKVEAFDLLHNRKNYRTTFGNNVWTETRQSGNTAYICFSVAYRLNRI